MARFNSYTSPKDEEELEKRKILAEELWRFTRDDGSPENAKTLIEEGSKIGVDRKQLSNLYKQYKEINSLVYPPKTFAEAEDTRKQFRELDRERAESNAKFKDEIEKAKSKDWYDKPWNMGSERRLIASPAGQMRSMMRKAARAGIDVGQLVSANRGDVMAAFGELEAAGLGSGGIRSQDEVKSHPDLANKLRAAREDLLRRQEEEAIKAEEERKRKEKEQEEERLAALGGGDITALRDGEERSPRRTTVNPNSRPTNPNRV